ncbi:MAG TPA: DEAD/DEAH box helicase [Chloroflexia bacterium]|nr:DEAD/DEAH box helicase [Chloroflexia bacterium]
MSPHELKAALPRTWGAFFRRHGNFTAAQLAAIPPLLAGDTVLLVAPTASGKTEAALAPLIERHLPPDRPPHCLTILYLLPTRALINDIWTRLAAPLEMLRITYAMKTHDLTTFDPKRPADLLLTTPESLDALLANQAKVLAGVRAVVVDELHIFEGTARGDQLRVLLNRVRQVRAHAAQVGDAPDAAVQGVALSATLAAPEATAARYFAGVRVVQVAGARAIHAEQIALAKESPAPLLAYLETFRARGWRKALAFCNTRAEIESYAATVRAAGSPFGEAVYVHYSNLEWERRVEIERQFAHGEAALCFASSTLELGIDVGNIDVTLLVGAPGSTAAFVQRVGRANRRQPVAQVACFYRTPLERIMFGVLLGAQTYVVPPAAFRPAVAIQQIFSLLKQSPRGAVRLAPLGDVFAGLLTTADLQTILGTLQGWGYLQSGRPGEWRAGPRLNELVDLQAAERGVLSLHSNLALAGADQIKIRDQASQRVVASVDRQWFDRDLLTLEGRPVNVTWSDSESLWVSPYRGADPAAHLRYLSTRQLLSYDLAHQFPAQVGLAPATAPLIPSGDGWLWFHWLGDVYGRAALDLIRYTLAARETSELGVCLRLDEALDAIPIWTREQVTRYLEDQYRRYEPLLALGAYHHLLPVELRRRAVVEQFDVAGFLRAIATLHVAQAPEALAQDLAALVDDDG